jgi:hypothetical protein
MNVVQHLADVLQQVQADNSISFLKEEETFLNLRVLQTTQFSINGKLLLFPFPLNSLIYSILVRRSRKK